jgi:hypothetical protein
MPNRRTSPRVAEGVIAFGWEAGAPSQSSDSCGVSHATPAFAA